MGKGQREKGSRAERDVANILQEWWRKLDPKAAFSRTPLSGGWGKTTDRAIAVDKKACGDLVTNSKRFPFVVEVKWREQWSPANVMAGRRTPPWDWWVQSVEAAREQDGVPMMWIRRNTIPGTRQKFPWLVWVPRTFYVDHHLDRPDIEWESTVLETNGVDYAGVLPVAYVFDHFIEMAPRRMASKGR